jgi:hypothetical protein
MFYLPASAHPLRYRLFAWLSVAGRALAAIFWLWQNPRWNLPGVQNFWMLDGSFAVVLLHRDASYMETAGEAARTLIETALPKRRRKRG